MNAPLAIYLHIPFCRTKCTYCAFNTYTNLDRLIDPFIGALCREIVWSGNQANGAQVGTVFLGGGTPSLLAVGQIAALIETIDQHFALDTKVEITIEANPNDIDERYARDLHHVGVNRISLGMQSANAAELALFARRHDNDQTARAVSAARAAGFTNLNLDLIYGVPHQTLDTWVWTLEQMLHLQPDHVSLYALGLEDGTPMQEWVAKGRLPAPDDDLAADMYELATDILGDTGFGQYEISNWAKPGFQCRHNLQYWRNLPYLGLGPGAHGYAGNTRYAVMLSPQRYIHAMLNTANSELTFPLTPGVDMATVIRMDRAGEMADTLLMGLRLTEEGIVRRDFLARFGIDIVEAHGATINKYVGYGLLDIDAERLRLTKAGRLLSNTIFRELI